MFEIQPISMTQIDWNAFVTKVNLTLQRSPTRSLDAAGVTPGLPPSYIAALAEFHCKGAQPNQAMKNSDLYLPHMSFGFLVSCDRETMHQLLIAGGDFSIIMAEPGRMKENFIITGTLETWKRAIIKSCQSEAFPEIREFMNYFWIFFDKMGFREIFADHRRKDLKDGTFALEQKR